MQSRLVNRNCLHLQVVQKTIMLWCSLRDPEEYWYIFNLLHSVISQKTYIFTSTAVRTSNPTLKCPGENSWNQWYRKPIRAEGLPEIFREVTLRSHNGYPEHCFLSEERNPVHKCPQLLVFYADGGYTDSRGAHVVESEMALFVPLHAILFFYDYTLN